jgi:predicted Rossmann fold flavoprotein
VSGGGRCNVTHEVVAPTDFFGNRRIIKNVLAAFSVEATIKWFASMGVELKREETGKLFPVTDRSRTVLNALVARCRELGVAILPDHRVTKIVRLPDSSAGFVVHHSHGALTASRVILATRPTIPSQSDGSAMSWPGGWDTTSRDGPALAPPCSYPHVSKNFLPSQEASITVARKCHARSGSLLWTHFGISGPVVMDASRFWCLAQEQREPVEVYGNFLPGQNQEQLRQWFMEQARDNPRRSLGKTFAQRLPQRFTESLIQHAGCDSQTAIAQVPKKDRDHLLSLLTKCPFPIVQDRGWNYAEVTAGGVPLEEINFRTMESKLDRGSSDREILDCDGRSAVQLSMGLGHGTSRRQARSVGHRSANDRVRVWSQPEREPVGTRHPQDRQEATVSQRGPALRVPWKMA